MKHVAALIALWALAPMAGAQDESVLAVLPEDDWIVIDPTLVEKGEDYAAYSDVFSGTGDKWKGSAIYTSYPVLATDEVGLTYEPLRAHVQALSDRLYGSQRFDSHNGDRIRRQLLDELQDLLMSIDGLLNVEGELTFDKVKDFIDLRFMPVPAAWKGTKIAGSEPGSTETVNLSTESAYFSSLPNQVVMRIDKATELLGMETFDPWRYYATLEQAIEFRTVVARVLKLFAEFQVPKWKDTSLRLSVIDGAWDNYLMKGYSQYPWESLLNSYATDFAWDRPPKSQWIFAHPEVGVVMDFSSSRGASTETAVLIHGAGYVRYFGDERDWFAGLSATAAVTENDDFGMGYGATLHLGHSKFQQKIPHISLSVLWQDFDSGGHGPVVGLSLDLGRLISDGGEGSYRKRLGSRSPDVPMR